MVRCEIMSLSGSNGVNDTAGTKEKENRVRGQGEQGEIRDIRAQDKEVIPV